MTILKNKLNVVLDIGKTNVKLIFLKNKKIVKEYKTKQQNSYFKNSIKNLEANKIVNWLIKKLKKESDKHILNNFVCTARFWDSSRKPKSHHTIEESTRTHDFEKH